MFGPALSADDSELKEMSRRQKEKKNYQRENIRPDLKVLPFKEKIAILVIV